MLVVFNPDFVHLKDEILARHTDLQQSRARGSRTFSEVVTHMVMELFKPFLPCTGNCTGERFTPAAYT